MESIYEVGNLFEYQFVITQEQVSKFAEISGDNNPIHFDNDFAANTIFKKPIIHGIFSSSVFSKYFGMINPGKGTIYLKQSIEFLRPMYVDIQYKATFKIISIDTIKSKAIFETCIFDTNTNKKCISGEAEIMNKEKIVSI